MVHQVHSLSECHVIKWPLPLRLNPLLFNKSNAGARLILVLVSQLPHILLRFHLNIYAFIGTDFKFAVNLPSQLITLDTCTSNFDTVLRVYDQGSALVDLDDDNSIVCATGNNLGSFLRRSYSQVPSCGTILYLKY